MKSIVSAIVIAAALLTSAQAQSRAPDGRNSLAQADRALVARDYPGAYRVYARHAASNPLAQFNLGMFERQGWGRPANPAAACAWFDKAARKNVPAAQLFLGDCYAQGLGRAVDGPAALTWYADAAASGIAAADCSAGELYLAGTIVPLDVARGLALCTKAAQAESVPAMLKLADRYRTDESTLALARFWYDQAAQRHSLVAQWRLGMMLSEGKGGPVDVAQGRFWLEHAAREGYAPAYLPVAILYANAPVQPASGALDPDDLAKIYLWNQAAHATTVDATQLAEIGRIDALVAAVMPADWRPELDRRVAAHLARFAPAAPSAPRTHQ